ncbi:hypothetical protein EDB85DRAFT_1896160 [Lactarius pseudohatsudake]|nr:hypothetical protein EDB85DRAFT_1896160 [Lactarius pseudohatsudake]
MCAVLLDQELGFTIRISEPNLLEGQDEGQVQGSSDVNQSQTVAAVSADRTVEGAATASSRAAIDSDEPDKPTLGEKKDVGYSQIRHSQLSCGVSGFGIASGVGQSSLRSRLQIDGAL